MRYSHPTSRAALNNALAKIDAHYRARPEAMARIEAEQHAVAARVAAADRQVTRDVRDMVLAGPIGAVKMMSTPITAAIAIGKVVTGNATPGEALIDMAPGRIGKVFGAVYDAMPPVGGSGRKGNIDRYGTGRSAEMGLCR